MKSYNLSYKYVNNDKKLKNGYYICFKRNKQDYIPNIRFFVEKLHISKKEFKQIMKTFNGRSIKKGMGYYFTNIDDIENTIMYLKLLQC
ncbi:MAG: hypothetical protein ACOCP8_03020 [archaeon]